MKPFKLFSIGLLFSIILTSCMRDVSTPISILTNEQVLKIAQKQISEKSARVAYRPKSDIERFWQLAAYHDYNGNYVTNSCFNDVVWNLTESYGAVDFRYWQVLNFSGNGCGSTSSCNIVRGSFQDWVINSGYNTNKHYYIYNTGDGQDRVYFEEISDCQSRAEFYGTWTVVNGYYLVIYPSQGGDLIFTKINDQ